MYLTADTVVYWTDEHTAVYRTAEYTAVYCTAEHTDVYCDGGEAGKLHPGLWKIPPRLLENPTQGSGKLQNLHEPCDCTFLDKQVSEEKF